MRGEEDAAQAAKRLEELAARAQRTGAPCFTGFLSPAEADLARIAAQRQRVDVLLEGGYEGAERCVACFAGEWEEPFPIAALLLEWPHQSAPGHRDVLGAVMGLGVKRECVGDIVVLQERAYLFAQQRMAEHIAAALDSAGRTKLRVSVLDELPRLEPPKGTELRGTVSSMRLDAVLSEGFGLSRANAAELIAAGRVKLCHVPTIRADARVKQGDAISARGYGRLMVEEIGAPTRKGRLPVLLIRYGESRKH